MKKYVIKPFRKIVKELREKEHKADAHYLKQVKKFNFKSLTRSVETVKFVRD